MMLFDRGQVAVMVQQVSHPGQISLRTIHTLPAQAHKYTQMQTSQEG